MAGGIAGGPGFVYIVLVRVVQRPLQPSSRMYATVSGSFWERMRRRKMIHYTKMRRVTIVIQPRETEALRFERRQSQI